MNIKITAEEHKQLCELEYEQFAIGSNMYGTRRPDSDFDFLRIYKLPEEWKQHEHLVTPHQFQYDDKENNTQFMWTDVQQFLRNLVNGDSMINLEVFLFYDMGISNVEKMNFVRTYKIIKALLGFAKRDLKMSHRKGKYFHIRRAVYLAKKLLRYEMPDLNEMVDKSKCHEHFATVRQIFDVEHENEIIHLREVANDLLNKSHLTYYNLPEVEDTLLSKRLNSLNIKEFKY